MQPFFQMNPNVAKVTDPQQRVFLELAWNALEHAGYTLPNRYDGMNWCVCRYGQQHLLPE
jgi:acyl transferase domain-containing protein